MILDYPILIQRLNDAGLTLAEIERKTGITQNTLSLIKNERGGWPEEWNKVCALLDIYFMHIPTMTLPVYGNHNESNIT